MKMEIYKVNVRETAPQPQEKLLNLQILRSPQGLKQGWNLWFFINKYAKKENWTTFLILASCYVAKALGWVPFYMNTKSSRLLRGSKALWFHSTIHSENLLNLVVWKSWYTLKTIESQFLWKPSSGTHGTKYWKTGNYVQAESKPIWFTIILR